MKVRNHPCAKDCPRRTATCRINCPDWAEYVVNRNADYEQDRKSKDAMYARYQNAVHERVEKRTRKK